MTNERNSSNGNAGPPAWTERQREVLDLLAKGRTNAEIAAALSMTLDGAKWHVSQIMAELGVSSRDEAADYWRAHNGLPAKLFRIVRGLLPAAASTKVVAGGALVLVAGAGAISLVSAASPADLLSKLGFSTPNSSSQSPFSAECEYPAGGELVENPNPSPLQNDLIRADRIVVASASRFGSEAGLPGTDVEFRVIDDLHGAGRDTVNVRYMYNVEPADSGFCAQERPRRDEPMILMLGPVPGGPENTGTRTADGARCSTTTASSRTAGDSTAHHGTFDLSQDSPGWTSTKRSNTSGRLPTKCR